MSTEVVKRKSRRRWLQFGVRSLLVLTLLAAVLFWLTTFWRPYQRQRAALDEIARLGGSYQTRPLGPSWLPEFLAKDYVEVTDVSFEDMGHERRAAIGSHDLRCLCHLIGVRRLCLSRMHGIDDGALASVSQLASLESLDLSYTPITDRGLCLLEDLPRLRELSLRYTNATEAGVFRLSRLRELEKLVYHHTGECGDVILGGFPALRRLELAECVVRLGAIGVSADSVIVTDMPKLEELKIEGCVKQRLALRRLPSLKTCTVALSGEAIVIEHAPALETLRLEPLFIEHVSLVATGTHPGGRHSSIAAALRQRDRLKRLELTACCWTDDDLAVLDSLPNMQTLALRAIPGMKGAGLRHLSHLKQLKELDLSGNPQLGDDALDCLMALPPLDELRLDDTSVSQPALRRLAQVHKTVVPEP